MVFGEIIKEVVERVEGGLAGVIMGVDGIAVDNYIKGGGELEIQSVGAEYAVIVEQVKGVSEMLKSGKLKEFITFSEGFILIIHSINEDYFAALALKPEGNYGKGRYLLRMAIPKIRAEF
ncbi:MAG: roadblock/LC7 domain-containing protein [Deltaproteobacteria bacterium]|nr:MAG: roadblock/LC7 domain-containing protein [Deltaproteobacteria bacterium]